MGSTSNRLLAGSQSLPYFSSLEELSALTGLSTRLLYCLSKQTGRYYRTKLVPKRSGGQRELHIPSYTLRIVQKWILVYILDKLLPSPQAMAFRRGKRYGHKQNARCHAQSLYSLALDLKDFFPSITAGQVYTVFSQAGYSSFAASILTNLCTLDGKLPQGSVCAPALSNLVCITLDRRLAGLCEKRGIVFTRYADDMHFSCDDKGKLLRCQPILLRIIQDSGFTINEGKTRFCTPTSRRQITGITVVQGRDPEPSELKAPKQMKRKVRSEIFRMVMTGDYSLQAHVRGEVAYITYVEGDSYVKSLKHYLDQLAEKIAPFPELVAAYNEHPLFPDRKEKAEPWTVYDIYCKAQGGDLRSVLKQRKDFLKKIGANDICAYNGWDLPRTVPLPELLGRDGDDGPSS